MCIYTYKFEHIELIFKNVCMSDGYWQSLKPVRVFLVEGHMVLVLSSVVWCLRSICVTGQMQ